jgi:MinD superfamily P-loop ATPase
VKRLLILSGKGGTGKTTMAGAFIRLAGCEAYADCDVDAPNLHLLLRPETLPETVDFFGMEKYKINPLLCRGCGRCAVVCRFDAIRRIENRLEILRERCEGCSTCSLVCPAKAIFPSPKPNGKLMLYRSKGVFSTARLHPGTGNSGLMVTSVKNRLRDASRSDLEIWDGSPGIGCPVIASMSGADLILAVTEPSLSGLSDLARMLQTASGFRIPVAVCVNKATANLEMTGKIDAFCEQNHIPMVGHMPYDPEVVRLTNSGLSIVDEDGPSGRAAREIFPRVMNLLHHPESA